MNSVKFIYVIFIAVLFFVSNSYGTDEVTHATSAWKDSLVDVESSNLELAKILFQESSKKNSGTVGWKGRIVNRYREFSKKNPKTTASLFAKYLIGHACLFEGICDNDENAKITFNDIGENFPGTFEAQLSIVGLKFIKLKNNVEGDNAALYEELITTLRQLIPLSMELDQKDDESTKAKRLKLLGSSDKKMVPYLKLDIASYLKKNGKYKQSRLLYNEIIRDYPNSIYSKKAYHRLNFLNE